MSGDGGDPLDGIIITAELERRPSRAPDYESESRALTGLMEVMARPSSADEVLQSLVETALGLFGAQSAGVSILEQDATGRDGFRWRAAAGSISACRGVLMPRECPSGTVLERNRALLMARPQRHYGCLRDIEPPIAEALLIPFRFRGETVGTVWIASHDGPRRFDAEDLRLLTSLGRFAGNAYQLLKQEALATDLAATERLQQISTQLLIENHVETLYQKIVDAAAVIMRSEFASMQMYHPERGPGGELKLLAYRGFTPEGASAWEWVRPAATLSCGVSLRTGERVIVPDTESCDFMAGSENLELYRRIGIRAVQSTPLVSRSGRIMGMISTHWRKPHAPAKGDLRLLDVLARQAADLIERSLAEHRTQGLLREVSHRSKNMLALVQAIAQQTAGSGDPAQFAERFSERLAGIAASQDLLVQSDWRGVETSELVRSQIAHFRELVGTRITLAGPPVRLAPAAAQTIGMALNELSTNAVKYGALSNGAGRVAVEWSLSANGAEPRFVMSWRERGGPPVTSPRRRGFGHSVLVRSVEHAIDAKASLDFQPAGVDWRVEAPAADVLEDAERRVVRAAAADG